MTSYRSRMAPLGVIPELFRRHPQTSMLLGDSQKYPTAAHQLRALRGLREEDNRKTRKAEGNAAGMGSQNRAL